MNRFYPALLLALASLQIAGLASAQLPELEAASASGLPTTAKFLGGVSGDGGQSYASSFAFDQPIDVLTEIQVEAAHVNTVGNLYVIIVLDNNYFMLTETSGFVLWDLTSPLQAASSAKTLQPSEPLSIVEGVAFGPAGIFGTSLAIYLAYDTMAAAGDLFYSALPLTFSIEQAVTEAASLSLFKETVSAQITQINCITCHIPGGLAQGTAQQYVSDTQPDYQLTNYNTLLDYIKSGTGAKFNLLNGPQGVDHGAGGVRLLPGSAELTSWLNFVEQLDIDAGN
jgi:mono/diheme cytochrome c family protein